MPYRSAHIGREKRDAEPGIVTDMVRQFADKHAFLRELVQNGIDAGATRIDVTFDRDDSGVVRTSVRDDGSGMSRAIIEGPLLTLFSSSKEGDRSKIGKYGIGFVSVFALEPEVVEVRTCTGAEAWLIRLFGDHSWELAEDKTAPRRGSTVTLVQPMSVEAFSKHVALGSAALERWCRHARVPVDVVVLDAFNPAATTSTTVNQPFVAPGLVSVIWTEGEERIVLSVGEAPGQPESFLGFYNRGLTLFETDRPERPELDGVRVKIDSPKLSHTLSRDGVVRDGTYRRLTALAVDLVRERLWPELSKAVAAAAFEGTSPERYLALLQAMFVLALAPVRSASRILVPLVDPIQAQRTLPLSTVARLSSGELLFAAEPNAATRSLAASGTPVVRWLECMPLLRGFDDDWRASEVDRVIAYSSPEPERHSGDDALEAELLALLRTIGLTAAAVQLARFEGAARDAPYRVAADRVSAVRAEKLGKPSWGASAVVHLNVEDAGVRLARRRARTDPRIASHLLCRALLVADGPLSAKTVDRLLEAALE